VFSITWFGDAVVPNFFFTKEVAVLLQSLSLATMETKLYNIFKSLEESVEQIKRSGLNDVDATNNVIQHAQNLLANIKPPMSEKEAENNSRKRKLDDTSPTDEDECCRQKVAYFLRISIL
jgi:hypothetical protein